MKGKTYNKKDSTSSDNGVRLQMMVLLCSLYNASRLHYDHIIHSYCFQNNFQGKFFCLLTYVTNNICRRFALQTKYKKVGDLKITLNGYENKNTKNDSVITGRNRKRKKNSANFKNRDFNLLETFQNYQLVKKQKAWKEDLVYIVYTNVNVAFHRDERRDAAETFVKTDLDGFNISDGVNICLKFRSEIIKDVAADLSKHTKHSSIQDLITFIENLVFIVNRPDHLELRENIKKKIMEEYSILEEELERKFPVLEDKLQSWWRKRDEQLCESNTFIMDALKLCVIFNVENSVLHFTGRQSECKSIIKHHLGSSPPTSNGAYQVVVISGCGGLGKTELAKEYIKRYKHYYDNNIIWIDAKELNQSFISLGKYLGINTIDDKSILQIYNHFINRKSLFVFDNVSSSEDLFKYLPLKHMLHKPYILVTSRNRDWGKDVYCLDLNVLSQAEAIALVCNALKVEKSKEVKSLVNTLQCYPLVLQQAIAYIKNMAAKCKNIGTYVHISNFVSSYENIKPKIFKFPESHFAKTADTIWNVTVNDIQMEKNGLLAIKLLGMMAYFAPLNISVNIFSGLDTTKHNISSAMRLLVKYSMINYANINEGFSIHEVVQEVFRLKNADQETNILTETLSLFTKIDSNNVNHAATAWMHASKYPSVIQQSDCLCADIADAQFNSSLFAEGAVFCSQVVEILNNFYKTSFNAIIKTKKVLGKIYLYQSKYDQATEVYTNVREMELKYFSPEDERVLDTENSLALVERHRGHYKVALGMFETLLEKKLNILGADHPITLQSKDEIAVIHQHLGMYDESLQEHLEIYNIKFDKIKQESEISGKALQYDNSILQTMDNIALVFNFLGNLEQSEKWFKDLLAIKEASLNENDPFLSKTRNNLGVLYIRQGKLDEGLDLFNKRLIKLREFYTDTTSSVIITLYNISLITYYKGQYNEAKKLNDSNLKNCTMLFSDTHIKTLQLKQLEGDILCKLGEYNKAMEIFNFIIDNTKELLNGGDTMETLQVRNSIGCVYMYQGDLKKALRTLEQVRKMKVKQFGENHSEVLRTEHSFGLVYKAQGKLGKALRTFQDVYERRLGHLGKEHFETIESLIEISNVNEMIRNSFFERFYTWQTKKHNRLWRLFLPIMVFLSAATLYILFMHVYRYRSIESGDNDSVPN